MSSIWIILALVALVWIFILLHSLVRKPLLAQGDISSRSAQHLSASRPPWLSTYLFSFRALSAVDSLVNPKVNLGYHEQPEHSSLCAVSAVCCAADAACCCYRWLADCGGRKVAGVHSIQGQRAHMEDSYYADAVRGFFAVYDGHGGSRASQFASKHLHELIFTHLPPSTAACGSHLLALLLPAPALPRLRCLALPLVSQLQRVLVVQLVAAVRLAALVPVPRRLLRHVSVPSP